MTVANDVGAAKREVERAEADLAAGGNVSFEKLNKLKDKFRHATLTAEGRQRQAEDERKRARLAGLEELGAQIDQLASQNAEPIASAVRDVAAAAARLRQLAASHDEAVAAIAAAARELGAEPESPSGPRPSSAFVAARLDHRYQVVAHGNTRVAPLGPNVGKVLAHAVDGDLARALAEAASSSSRPQIRRPENLLRGQNGNVFMHDDPLPEAILYQITKGEVTKLSAYDIDRWMAGELG